MSESIVLATSNPNKAREIGEILGSELDHAKLELDEIQSMDLRVIVEHKLKQAFAELAKPVLVEDAGLYLDGWKGFPGPFIKSVVETMGMQTLADSLGDDRRAAHMVVYGLYDGNKMNFFEGRTEGKLSPESRGDDGWVFDFYFIPDGYEQTYAELGAETKNTISPRYTALQKLKAFLTDTSNGD